jgi:hypothetical protein
MLILVGHYPFSQLYLIQKMFLSFTVLLSSDDWSLYREVFNFLILMLVLAVGVTAWPFEC